MIQMVVLVSKRQDVNFLDDMRFACAPQIPPFEAVPFTFRALSAARTGGCYIHDAGHGSSTRCADLANVGRTDDRLVVGQRG